MSTTIKLETYIKHTKHMSLVELATYLVCLKVECVCVAKSATCLFLAGKKEGIFTTASAVY